MKKYFFGFLVGMLAIGFSACENNELGGANIVGKYYSYQDDTETELNLLSNHSFSYSMDQYISRTGNELETYGSGTWSYREGKIYCEGYFYRINHNNPSSNWAKNDIYEFEYHTSYVKRGGVTMTKQ